MFIRASTIVAALAAVAAAAPGNLVARNDPSQCNTGALQCCDSTYSTTSTTITQLTGILGITLPDILGSVGLGCTPITVIGTGSGASCTQQPVCCTDNQFNGLINVGCSPITLGL